MKLRGKACFCRSCGRYFRAISTFDKHRVGAWSDRRCLTDIEMADEGLALDAKGYWRKTWTGALPEMVA